MENEAAELLLSLGAKVDLQVAVSHLTIAQRQMVEIAKALQRKAEIIVMDEPSATLTPTELESLFRMVHTLRSQGKSIVYVSHRLDEVFRLADRVTVLRDGRKIGTRPINEVNRDMLITMMVGRPIKPSLCRRPSPASVREREVVLEVRHLCSPPKVKDVSFQLFRGEILGIAGLVGAGRTELAHAIFGTSEKRSSSCRRGEVRVFGEGMKPKVCGLLSERRSPRAALLAGIGLVPEDRKELGIFPAMSLADNLFISNYRPVQRGLFLSSRLLKQESEKLIKALDIRTTGWQQQMKNLSGGNQQKAILARWLNAEVQILIFDEPTRGIDVGAKEQIHTLMRKLADAGKSIIMISSELPEILSMSDRILVMHEGRLVGELSAQEATEEKILRLASERKEMLQ